MTNEELKVLKDWLPECELMARYNDNSIDYQRYSALDMAIKALEQQPCEDCISRKAVIKLVEQYPVIIGNRYSGLIADIEHLPSVTPKVESEDK